MFEITGLSDEELSQFLVVTDDAQATSHIIRIKCKRGAGDVQTADIISPLTTDLNAALQLGRVNLDQGSRPIEVSQEVLFNGNEQIGEIVKNYDPLTSTWNGIIIGIEHALNNDADLTTNLTLLKNG